MALVVQIQDAGGLALEVTDEFLDWLVRYIGSDRANASFKRKRNGDGHVGEISGGCPGVTWDYGAAGGAWIASCYDESNKRITKRTKVDAKIGAEDWEAKKEEARIAALRDYADLNKR